MDDPRLSGGDGVLIYRWREAMEADDPAVMLLHGRTGDETVMWVVAEALPSRGLMVAPRAPFVSTNGGYSWEEPPPTGKATFEGFEPSVSALEALLDRLEDERGLDRRRLILVGFSQGTALAFAVARDERTRPQGIVALAGFLPDGNVGHLRDVPIFWGHGTLDTKVPIERARADVERLRRVGTSVQFCEAEVEHRVGVECMRGLRQWWQARFSHGGSRGPAG
jgi:phospholipase/carboxylesterase